MNSETYKTPEAKQNSFENFLLIFNKSENFRNDIVFYHAVNIDSNISKFFLSLMPVKQVLN